MADPDPKGETPPDETSRQLAGSSEPEKAEQEEQAREVRRRRKLAEKREDEREVFWQKCGLVVALTLVSLAVLLAGGWILRGIERPRTRQVEVEWKLPDGFALDSGGPVTFWHDRSRDRLVYRGLIDGATKAKLLALSPEAEEPEEEQEREEEEERQQDEQGPLGATERPGEAEATNEEADELHAARRSYREAIDRLAFDSAAAAGLEHQLLWLLLLGAVGGLLGVQLRSVSNFVGVVCIKDSFDFKRWWPWYVLRPVLGLLVGLLVVVLIKADLFTLETEPAEAGNLWWLGLAVLAGFGAEDFVLRLRLISHTLFGVAELEKTDTEPAREGDEAEEKRAEEQSGKGDGETRKPEGEDEAASDEGEEEEGELTTRQKL